MSNMTEALITRSVTVPGASIYVEKRGSGPNLLLLPGGAQDAGVFTGLATALSDHFTVISLDPRCNSRSPCEDTTSDLNVDQHADDAAAVIATFGGGPIFVFGTSGGAQVGLNLAARHPDLVRALVAHEPPSMMLMADPSVPLAADQALYDTYVADGVEAAIAQFMAENGLDEGEVQPPEMSPEDRETFDRMSGNFEYWLAHGMLPLSRYRADVEALKAGALKIIVGLGEASVGQPIHEMGTALSVALGVEPVTFPGDHMGFGMDPARFAETLRSVLTAD
ncbi:alpha/beta hydrolase [Tabrizicola piscis]|uniref:Alpha/beta hydrolase n=2 Tax=Tabrizicola piscis TaxID=2494374 RepID=A0A3S8UBK7_9RHOB|nr:alpha/beta hydrolase [Tabrizicola piscis]